MKTVVLKEIFESTPMSRSQAKGLYIGWEVFETIEIDFDGLEWMGQGFAHQLFVIFQREHPHIELKPINMAEGVAKMYNHVTWGAK